MTTNVTPEVGIVGYGRFGRFLHRAWGASVVAVCDPADTTGARSAAPYQNLDALLEDDRVTIVAVATEPSTHCEMARRAIGAGKHVLIEKPPALTVEEVEALAVEVEQRGRVATIDYPLRAHPMVEAILRVDRSNRLGRVRSVTVTNFARADHLAPDHWFWDERRSGGILIEHGVHFFDLADRLVGERPMSVSGSAHRLADGRVDQRTATVTYPGGAVGHHVHAFCRTEPGETTTIDVGFQHATIRLNGWIPLVGEMRVDPGLSGLEEVAGELSATRLVDDDRSGNRIVEFGLAASKEDVYLDCLRGVLRWTTDAVRRGVPPEVTLEDGSTSLATAVAATVDGDRREGASR